MTLGRSISLHGDQIYNLLEEYQSQISSDSETEAKFDSSDSGWSHVDDIAFSGVASKIDIEGENESNEDFLWEDKSNYVGQREAFYNVSGPQSSARMWVVLWSA
jgi:hypothetical protein